MKQRVLFVATVLRAHVLVFHVPYMRWFQQQGYEVHLCCSNDTPEPVKSVPGCDRFIELPFSRSPFSLSNIKVYRQLKKLIDEGGYSLIHCNTPVGGMLGRLAARGARGRGTRVVYTAHGFHFFTGAPLKNWLLFYPVERVLSRFTDLLVTINGEDYARARRFHAQRAALVSGVGVDLTRFEGPVDRAEVRRELGLSADDTAVICVGEHSARKTTKPPCAPSLRLKGRICCFAAWENARKRSKPWPGSWAWGSARTFWAFAGMCPLCCARRISFCSPRCRRGFPSLRWRPWPQACPAW